MKQESFISRDEVSEVATTWGFALTENERDDLTDLADGLLTTMSATRDMPSAVSEPAPAFREVGGRPEREEDPLNAIVRSCSIKSEDASGMLSGVRLAVKDCIAIAGVPMTAGSSILQGFVPRIDSTVTKRVLSAGAQITAITNMDDLAMAAGGDSSIYGPTLCPFDQALTAGGSSSGSAAALHYDRIDMSLGTDTGGSIRVPSSWCGVLGLKPSYGNVPYTGILAVDQLFDHVGPIARESADLARLMQVLSGNDGLDPRQRDEVPELNYIKAAAEAPRSLSGIRIGVLVEGFSADNGVERDVSNAVHHSIGKLRKLGAKTVEVSVPQHLSAGPVMFSMLTEGLAAGLSAGGNGYQWEGDYWPELSLAIRQGLTSGADALSPQVKLSIICGTHNRRKYSGEVYARASNIRRWLRDGYERALSGCDVLLMPTTPGLPFENRTDIKLADRVMRSWATLGNTSPTNITGHPAISLPMAKVGSLSVGVMAIGRRFDDARLIGLASTIEREIGWNMG